MNSVLLGYNDILNNYVNTRQAHKTNKTSCPLPFLEGKNVFKTVRIEPAEIWQITIRLTDFVF